jgi:hypothetical protein
MDNWTKRIILEETDPHVIARIERSKGYNREYNNSITLALMLNPLVAYKYETLVDAFKEHPLAYQLNVRNPRLENDGETEKRWFHIKPYEITSDTTVESIAILAKADPHQCEHFEMDFRPPVSKTKKKSRWPLMKFRREGSAIYSSRVRLFGRDACLFDSKIDGAYKIEAVADLYQEMAEKNGC